MVKNGGRLWPQCGEDPEPTWLAASHRCTEFPPPGGERCCSAAVRFFGTSVLTFKSFQPYIRRHGAPSSSRRDGAPPKLLTFRGTKASDRSRRLEASAALRPTGGGNCQVPGLFDR